MKFNTVLYKYGRDLTVDQQKELYDILHAANVSDRYWLLKKYIRDHVGIILADKLEKEIQNAE